MDIGQTGAKVSTVPIEHFLGLGGSGVKRSECGVDAQQGASGLVQAQRVNHTVLPFLM